MTKLTQTLEEGGKLIINDLQIIQKSSGCEVVEELTR